MKQSVLAVIVTMCLSTPLKADWVHLKNGSKIQGKVIKRSDGKVHLDLPDGTLRIRTARIERIEKEGETRYKLNQARRKRDFGAYDDALTFLQDLLDERPSANNIRKEYKTTLESAAKSAFRNNRISRARDLVHRGLDRFPDDRSLRKLERQLENHQQKTQKLLQKAKQHQQAQNPERAIDLYKRVLDRSPGRMERLSDRLAGAYADAGREAYRNKQFDRAISRFESCVEYDPERVTEVKPIWVRAVLQRSSQFLQKQEIDSAQSLLERHLDIFPADRRLTFQMGRSQQLAGQVKEAIQTYASILNRRVSPGSADVRTLQKQAAQVADLKLERPPDHRYDEVLEGDWRTVETEHFKIFHRNNQVAERAEALVEHYYRRIREEVRHPSLDRDVLCEVYIYPSRSKYREQGQLPDWSAGETQVVRSGKKRTQRILTYQNAPQLFSSVLPHEIGHVMFHRMMQFRPVPQWLEEGVAVRFEHAYARRHYLRQVRSDRSNGRLMELEQLMTMNRYPEQDQERNRFYAQSYSLVRFLLAQGGWRNLIRLGRRLPASTPQKQLEDIYGFSSLSDVRTAWLKQVSSD